MVSRMLMKVIGVAVALLATAAGSGAQEIVATPGHASGVYGVGEAIVWQLSVRGTNADKISTLHYTLKRDGLAVMGQGDIELKDGAGKLETRLDRAATVLVELKADVPGGKPIRQLVGAVAAPEKIQASSEAPGDFDAFWKAKIDELHKVPANAVLEAADSGKPNVEYYKVRMDNIRGSHIYGQLAKPHREGKFPALLIVQWAGVYGLPMRNVVSRAEQGWLALNIMAHDLPFDRPEAFYKDAQATTLKDYFAIGNDDREKSYFLRMYLSCYRAADYLSQRDDWDGQVMVVMGTSQGGQQTLITAGLHRKITAMMANVPGGCDTTAPSIGRAAGFPYWANYAKWNKKAQITETGRYFDVANFAARIKCPALVSLGLIDETCPPAGVLAACNRIQGAKEVLILPKSDHHGNHNAQARYFARSEAWLRAMVKGEKAPVEAGKEGNRE